MDVSALALFLAPLLGALVKSAGIAASERATEAIGESVWEHARRLWARLRPAVESKPAAEEAVQDVVDHPDNETARTVFTWQLQKLLDSDAALRADIEQLWAERPQAGVVAGERGVAVGGSIDRATIITGDRNVLRGDP